MATSRNAILAGAALLLGACASDPYHHGDRYSYGYGGGPAYYDPNYTGPGNHYWRGDRGDREGGRAAGSSGQDERG